MPQAGQGKLQSTTDDYTNIIGCQNFEQVMEHGFVLFLADYDKGYHVYDDTKHGKGQNYMVKHGSLKKLKLTLMMLSFYSTPKKQLNVCLHFTHIS